MEVEYILLILWIILYFSVLYFFWEVPPYLNIPNKEDYVPLKSNKNTLRKKDKKDKQDKIRENKNNFVDSRTERNFSSRWIKSQLPYTKNNHFWLVERERLVYNDKTKNSIEIVKNTSMKTIIIRYWSNNRIDGTELLFSLGTGDVECRQWNNGKRVEMILDEKMQDNLFENAKSLFHFYCENSIFLKSLNLEKIFDN